MWVDLFITVSVILLLMLLFPLGYLLLLAIGAIRSASTPDPHHRSPSTRFMIIIPAHDEAAVIKTTVSRLLAIDYPSHLFSIHIIADHCSDNTAEARSEERRVGKECRCRWWLYP